MEELFDLAKFDSYKEDNRREFKRAEGGLSNSLWDTINNRKKISINLLKNDDVETFSVAGADDMIMVIWVPGVKREQKPVYINGDLFGGTFRRNWEGDYHCTRL